MNGLSSGLSVQHSKCASAVNERKSFLNADYPILVSVESAKRSFPAFDFVMFGDCPDVI